MARAPSSQSRSPNFSALTSPARRPRHVINNIMARSLAPSGEDRSQDLIKHSTSWIERYLGSEDSRHFATVGMVCFQPRRAITSGNQKAQEHPHSRSEVLRFPLTEITRTSQQEFSQPLGVKRTGFGPKIV